MSTKQPKLSEADASKGGEEEEDDLALFVGGGGKCL
jgi:hypothetical protein